MKRHLLVLAALFVLAACAKDTTDSTSEGSIDKDSRYYTSIFAYNIMNTYYLWYKEISDGLSGWTFAENPIEKVASLRYRGSDGAEVDKWTELMEDYSSFESSVTGNGKTHGFEFVLYYADATKQSIVAVVTYTFAGSPAQEAGLKRGDTIITLDGEALTPSNYKDLLNEKVYDHPALLKLGLVGGRTLEMQARTMYSDPVQMITTLNVDGKEIGYLHFTNFTQDACFSLAEAFQGFKSAGIEELILDLRYNTGGYESTSAALASMIAPPSVVREGAVFNKSIYNDKLASEMEEDLLFSETITLDGKQINLAEANPGIRKLWVIVTGHSASASEALICGLKPYMDVTLVGSNTYGKFCGGYLIPAEKWFEALSSSETSFDIKEGKNLTKGWGIYVIASRYADCNGVTLSMPAGIRADYDATDDPRDGFDLGNPSESMLATVLSHISGSDIYAVTRASSGHDSQEVPFVKPGEGVLLW